MIRSFCQSMDCIFEFEFSDDVLILRIFDIQIEGFDWWKICVRYEGLFKVFVPTKFDIQIKVEGHKKPTIIDTSHIDVR